MVKVALAEWVIQPGPGRRVFLQVDRAGAAWLIELLGKLAQDNPKAELFSVCLSDEEAERCPPENRIS